MVETGKSHFSPETTWLRHGFASLETRDAPPGCQADLMHSLSVVTPDALNPRLRSEGYDGGPTAGFSGTDRSM
jgi:hypothetical protein